MRSRLCFEICVPAGLSRNMAGRSSAGNCWRMRSILKVMDAPGINSRRFVFASQKTLGSAQRDSFCFRKFLRRIDIPECQSGGVILLDFIWREDTHLYLGKPADDLPLTGFDCRFDRSKA